MLQIFKRIIFIIIGIFFLNNLEAQVSVSGLPKTFSYHFSDKIPIIQVMKPDVGALIAEDFVEEQRKDVPIRFGKEIESNISLQNSGVWKTLSNGDRVWMLELKAPDAVSINLNYERFYMPKGAKLYIYSPDHQQVLGAFTSQNNKEDGKMATGLIKGSSCIIEYYEPFESYNQGILEISGVVYGYKDLFSLDKSYGGSGSCNNNINCTVGNDWQKEKRGVAMILTASNTRKCTGTLINNVRQDARQFFLTANHCLGSESNWIFMFNYESPNCSPVSDGFTNQTVHGATLRAASSLSDFALLEIKEAIPDNYYVQYCGWDANDVASDSVVCIHHPSGDVKKISFDYNFIASGDYEGSNPPNSHWTILNWEDGTTEGGSSGSPLFNKNHRIIGQLHGGNASCSKNLDDSFGKFSFSWATTADSNKQLKFWLDPDNTGIKAIDGTDLNSSIPSFDGALTEISSPRGASCNLNIVPTLKIKNQGRTPITNLKIKYRFDAGPFHTFNWNQSLYFTYSASIMLPDTTLEYGKHSFEAYLDFAGDEDHSNDTLRTNFWLNRGDDIVLSFKPDNYTNETHWYLLDSSKTVIASNGILTAHQTQSTTWCLDSGCYTFVITDSQGDGLGGADTSASAVNDDGSFMIKHGDVELSSGGGYFKDSLSTTFCFELTGISNSAPIKQCSIYPNPTNDLVYIENNSTTPVTIEVCNILGEVVLSTNLQKKLNTLNISVLPNGVYYIYTCNQNEKTTCKIVKR